MGCKSKVELNVCQVTFLISLCSIAVILAVFGWFRGIDIGDYEASSASSKSHNTVASVVHAPLRAMPHADDIGSPPLLNNAHSYVQWTFLQMNDVYELKPLGGGTKGGMARVATIRKLLLQENPNTITVVSGDVVSPSALGNSVVNGSMLSGRQMIGTLNVLGLNYATLGNHEFDLKEISLRRRLDESKFEWIGSNVYELNTTKPFHNIAPYKILTIANVKILLIGLTIDDNLGPSSAPAYVHITSQRTLPHFTTQYIKHLRDELKLQWDILIALTHLNLQNDIDIIEQNPDIHVLLGGHEHENYYLKRGSKYTPIYKADGNAFSVFIHRFAYQPTTKQLLIYSKLAQVSEKFSEEPHTAEIADYYYQAGLQAYRDQGYIPEREVCTLPSGFNLDGRSAIIRSQQTYLTRALCYSMMAVTNTTICVFNAGAIRIDDQLTGTITQYDILRCLPFAANLITIHINGTALNRVLNRGLMNINNGMFISYAGLEYDASAEKWYLQSNHQLVDDENLQITFVSIPYFFHSTDLKHSSTHLGTYTPITRAFIDYLGKTYKKTRRRSSS
ncbi:unnamed protein product [Rotaria socialis]|uniref:5'-nucleotidase n=3 Tax=Rotaria socialis TaxID=392032 RepID=A0A820FSP3_9BILA|nr:unnamed protein product [Rotaria socialis]CAF3411246.1 unnamed protein product [Rotaria socialis]CAF3577695.1 unnamed protein product [Rotaria socialis]CAF4269227.1 unnamed protein product [Rotaria socialis]